MTWLEGSKVPGGAEKRYFISYASEDVIWAEEVARYLRATGISVFWDKLSLRAGDTWPDALRAAVAEADVLWLGWSEHASRSAWVKEEYSAALAKGPNAIRIDLLDGCDLPDELGHIQAERSALARGMADRLIRAPVLDLPADDVKPSSLLRSEHAVVPFIARDAELASIESWCEAADPFAVRLYVGAGGTGKTRLAIEACLRQKQRGWDAGILESRGLAESLSGAPEALDDLLAPRRAPRLVVLDYAETQRAHVNALLWRAARKTGGEKVRLILLARTAGDWWTELQRGDVRFGSVLGSGAEPIELAPIAGDVDERVRVFEAAASAFAVRMRKDRPPPPPAGALDGDTFAQVLFLHMAAYAAVLGETISGRLDLLDFVLEREAGYWRREADDLKLGGTFVPLLPVAVSVAALAGGYDSAAKLGEALACHADLAEYPRLERVAVARVLASLYREGGRIAPLAPDPLAEHLVWRTASTDRSWMLTWFKAADERAAAHGLVVLTRMNRAHYEARDWLGEVLAADLARLVVPAIDVAVQNGDPIGVVLAACLEREPRPDLAVGMMDKIPEQTVALRELAVVITEQAAGVAGEADVVALLKNNLGNRLSDLGRREEALAAADEAVSVYRRLAADRPDAFLPYLAASLNNLGNMLSDLGRREEALAAAVEAVSIRRRLAADRPDAFLPDLAGSLNNLSAMLRDLGRRKEALAAADEAVSIRRRLAADRPDAFRPDLAMSLNNLSASLSDLGRQEEALAAADEAVTCLRQHFLGIPRAHAGNMLMFLRNYIDRAEEAGATPDIDLIGPIVEVLNRLQNPPDDE